MKEGANVDKPEDQEIHCNNVSSRYVKKAIAVSSMAAQTKLEQWQYQLKCQCGW